MTQRKKPSAALSRRNADRHTLYEISVQRPHVIAGFIDELFDHIWHKSPVVLREDFCGTANLASHWIQTNPSRYAIGIDMDSDVLSWADDHNRKPLGSSAKRLNLICADVMKTHGPRADVVVSLNFSHFIYKSPDRLLAYFKHARRNLKPQGLFIIDAFGGAGSIEPCIDERPFSEFDYLWEQKSFDPLTNEIVCHIHFRFRNGQVMKRAFSYHWRMWSLPELRELLLKAGFNDIGIYFESEDGFVDKLDIASRHAWVAYIVAAKDKSLTNGHQG